MRDSLYANIVAADMEKIIASDDHKKLFHKDAKTTTTTYVYDDAGRILETKVIENDQDQKKDASLTPIDIAQSLISLSSVLDSLGLSKTAVSTMEAADCLIAEATPPHDGDDDDLLEHLGLRATTEGGKEFEGELSDQIALEIFDKYPELEKLTRDRLKKHKGIEDEEIEGVGGSDTYLDDMLGETETPLKGDTLRSEKQRYTKPYLFEENDKESPQTGKTITPSARYEGPGKAENFLELNEDLLGDQEPSDETPELAGMSPEEVVDQIRAANAELDDWLQKRGIHLEDEDDDVCELANTGLDYEDDDACGLTDMGLAEDDDDDTDSENKDDEGNEDPSNLSDLLNMKKPWEDFEEEE